MEKRIQSENTPKAKKENEIKSLQYEIFNYQTTVINYLIDMAKKTQRKNEIMKELDKGKKRFFDEKEVKELSEINEEIKELQKKIINDKKHWFDKVEKLSKLENNTELFTERDLKVIDEFFNKKKAEFEAYYGVELNLIYTQAPSSDDFISINLRKLGLVKGGRKSRRGRARKSRRGRARKTRRNR